MGHEIKWRFYEARDEAAVLVLHAQMEKRIGCELDLPPLDQRPVIATVVGETNGVVTHGLFLEAEVEVCAIGANPLPAKEIRGAVELLMPILEHYKIRIARAFVPTSMVEGKRGRRGAVGRILDKMGFTQEENAFQFFKWLIPNPRGGR